LEIAMEHDDDFDFFDLTPEQQRVCLLAAQRLLDAGEPVEPVPNLSPAVPDLYRD
jgi:hypothetical protein